MGWNKMSGNQGRDGQNFVDPSEPHAQEVEAKNATHEEENASWLFPEGKEVLQASEETETEESEYARFLRLQLKEDREGSFTRDALEEPTDEELDLLLGTFIRYKGQEWLRDFLAKQGWNNFSDPWEIRAALRVAEREFLRTLF